MVDLQVFEFEEPKNALPEAKSSVARSLQGETPFLVDAAGRFIFIIAGALFNPKLGHKIECLAAIAIKPSRRIDDDMVDFAVAVGVLGKPEGVSVTTLRNGLPSPP